MFCRSGKPRVSYYVDNAHIVSRVCDCDPHHCGISPLFGNSPHSFTLKFLFTPITFVFQVFSQPNGSCKSYLTSLRVQVFGGVGIACLPLSLIFGYIRRPKAIISRSQYIKVQLRTTKILSCNSYLLIVAEMLTNFHYGCHTNITLTSGPQQSNH